MSRTTLPLLATFTVFALLSLGLAGFGAVCVLAFGKFATGACCYAAAHLAGWQARCLLCQIRVTRPRRDE